jgi:AmmeMemoRadiSam system protein B
MQLPFLKYILKNDNNAKLVPIIVGQINNKKEKKIGSIISD